MTPKKFKAMSKYSKKLYANSIIARIALTILTLIFSPLIMIVLLIGLISDIWTDDYFYAQKSEMKHKSGELKDL